MKFTFALLVLLLFSWPASICAQDALTDLSKLVAPAKAQCDLSQASLRKFYLGMTVAEVGQLFPSWKPPRATASGEIEAEFRVPKATKAEIWRGVRTYVLKFFDSRLYSILTVYSPSDLWETPDEFASTVSETMKLPDQWEVSDARSNARFMTCGTNWIAAGVDRHYPFVAITDRLAQERSELKRKEASYAMQEMIEADRESKRKAFKP